MCRWFFDRYKWKQRRQWENKKRTDPIPERKSKAGAQSRKRFNYTHSGKEVRFLRYNVEIRRIQEIFKVKGPTKNYTKRKLNNMVELGVLLDEKIMEFLYKKGVIKQKK